MRRPISTGFACCVLASCGRNRQNRLADQGSRPFRVSVGLQGAPWMNPNRRRESSPRNRSQ
jgi:predicted component of type VI protein secretion system